MFAKRVVFHLDGDVLSHPLHLRRQIIVLGLRPKNDTVLPVVNALLIPLAQCFQNFEARQGVASSVRRGVGEMVMAADTVVPGPLLLVMIVITAEIRIIPRRCGGVRLQVCYHVVGYVRRRAWGSGCVNLFCRNSIFDLKFLLLTYLS